MDRRSFLVSLPLIAGALALARPAAVVAESIDYNALLAGPLKAYQQAFVDEISRGNVLLKHLREKGRRTPGSWSGQGRKRDHIRVSLPSHR